MILQDWLSDLHLLRPHALWLLPLGWGVLWALARFRRAHSAWSRVIPEHLLKHLQDGRQSAQSSSRLGWMVTAWTLACLALSGPSWQRLPEAVYKNEAPLVVILDLSWSLYATDLSPNRLTRARHKIRDIIDSRDEGTTALIAYAGDAYRVAPLTDDRATITNLLSVLEPSLMPVAGSRASQGVRLALEMLGNQPAKGAHILILTDEISPSEAELIRQLMAKNSVTLSIIGVGTPQGGPIQVEGGGYLRDGNGAIVIPRLDAPTLQALARSLGGRYATISVKDSDWLWIQADAPAASQESQLERTFDQWADAGYWLLLPLLCLTLASFRRGWLLTLLLPLLVLPAKPSYALDWDALWKTPDQQGADLLQQNQPAEAARHFHDPQWRGYAQFRAGDYAEAANSFAQGESLDDRYNQANAEAMAGNLQEALSLYEQVLEQQPNHPHALKNRDLIEQLLQKSEEASASEESQPSSEQQSGSQTDAGNSETGQEGQAQGAGEATRSTDSAEMGDPEETSRGAPGSSGNTTGQPPSEQVDQPANPAASSAEGGRLEPPKSDQQGVEQASSVPSPSQEASADDSAAQDSRSLADTATDEATLPLSEDRQATEGWLRRIKDDPSGLLRRKFELQQRQRAPQQAGEKIW
ncbi:VWA domain-containing protein [Aestuariirhabdus litorea]|uniref:VWA domain-containing protein n=1 Tax=Aestuariirhabdus litorea TaxID=2528527 RepID=A0A3P3VQ47_9GAMM|nr:VWA domain-containing protein [Aestuariirhabdus litorea]RRJ84855.1 VWA domain-containing protein [Aestuariirhabdus litorea]RWW98082.1 VWA domain-containing protein [Endozoicomonadaceae bacterium GTF-13]